MVTKVWNCGHKWIGTGHRYLRKYKVKEADNGGYQAVAVTYDLDSITPPSERIIGWASSLELAKELAREKVKS